MCHLVGQYCLWVCLFCVKNTVECSHQLCGLSLLVTSGDQECVRKQNDSGWLLQVCSNQRTSSSLLLWNSPSALKWRRFGFFRWHLTLEKCGKTPQTDSASKPRTSCRRDNTLLWNEVWCLMDRSILRVWTGTDNCTDTIVTWWFQV